MATASTFALEEELCGQAPIVLVEDLVTELRPHFFLTLDGVSILLPCPGRVGGSIPKHCLERNAFGTFRLPSWRLARGLLVLGHDAPVCATHYCNSLVC